MSAPGSRPNGEDGAATSMLVHTRNYATDASSSMYLIVLDHGYLTLNNNGVMKCALM
jgi:hypothetical protein